MTLDQFVTAIELDPLREVDKACVLAFYFLRKEGLEEFTVADCAKWIHALNLGNPNVTRLGKALKNSSNTIAGKRHGSFRLHHSYVKKLDENHPHLREKNQEVTDSGTILPEALYKPAHGYIARLAQEINASYEQNIFDGCAVLMRRLEEVLLILSYNKLGICDAIKDGNGNYFLLEGIVKDAEVNRTLDLSRNGKKSVDDIRKLGNYSAHKITYICRREYIKEKIDEYRALIDELLHKSGVLT